jgi:UDP-hydrolysing UDP-N-acetyl-D-glucosamine 2-epimerase
MHALAANPGFKLEIVATGMNLSPEFGFTVRHIEDAGFTVHSHVESLLSSDTPEGIGKSIGLGTMGFAQLFANWHPDILVVHGDRFDALPPVLAALPYRIPVAHISGGDVTEGAMDDSIRHAMTKLSHLHFVETESSRNRVLQMGEEAWRVTCCGSLALDTIRQTELMDVGELNETFGIGAPAPFLLVTFHPVTMATDQTAYDITEVLAAIDKIELPAVFTYPNADTSSRVIIDAINAFCATKADRKVVVNAGQRGYLSLMAHASAMIGNSSSGIVEAASFKLPVVNVGDRQCGRASGLNVIDCSVGREKLCEAITQALSDNFRATLGELDNVYGDGYAADHLVRELSTVEISDRLLRKRFSKFGHNHTVCDLDGDPKRVAS